MEGLVAELRDHLVLFVNLIMKGPFSCTLAFVWGSCAVVPWMVPGLHHYKIIL